jgi:hypothetical protein
VDGQQNVPIPSGFGWGDEQVLGSPTQKVSRIESGAPAPQVELPGSWTHAATGDGPALQVTSA